MKLAVIIVKYRAERDFRRCIESVKRHTPESVPVVVHDNGPQNENLGKLWNRLIARLPADVGIVVLLNPDTVVSAGWVEQLAAGVGAGHAAVGPLTNQCGYPKQMSRGPEQKRRFTEMQALSGFCVALDRNAFNEAGRFREDFPLYGQDSDLFMRLRRRSKTLAIARHVFVHHRGSASVREARRRGEIPLESVRRKAEKMYRDAVRRERRLRPRVLGVVGAGGGQEVSRASLLEAGMDEVHIVPGEKIKRFIKSRERFFEAAVSVKAGEVTRLDKKRALAIASNGGALSVTRLPVRRGDA